MAMVTEPLPARRRGEPRRRGRGWCRWAVMLSSLAEQPLELSMSVELNRTWLAASAATTPPRTLEITQLDYESIEEPLVGTALGTMQCGASATWTAVRQALAVADATFLKLSFKEGPEPPLL